MCQLLMNISRESWARCTRIVMVIKRTSLLYAYCDWCHRYRHCLIISECHLMPLQSLLEVDPSSKLLQTAASRRYVWINLLGLCNGTLLTIYDLAQVIVCLHWHLDFVWASPTSQWAGHANLVFLSSLCSSFILSIFCMLSNGSSCG